MISLKTCSLRSGFFADNATVYLTVDNQNDSKPHPTPPQHPHPKKDLDTSQTWERTWDMEFSPSNCPVLQISRANEPIHSQYTMHKIQIGIVQIEIVQIVNVTNVTLFRSFSVPFCYGVTTTPYPCIAGESNQFQSMHVSVNYLQKLQNLSS